MPPRATRVLGMAWAWDRDTPLIRCCPTSHSVNARNPHEIRNTVFGKISEAGRPRVILGPKEGKSAEERLGERPGITIIVCG